ncbi:MAG: hypothetical protein FOGNACKC_05471 [Anaerolineae bacterium]|nr:hypothetical protein [Anaerolineae bacterium]
MDMITVTARPTASRIKRLSEQINFNDMRKICEARGALLEKGAGSDFSQTLDDLRLSFIRATGVYSYILGMLKRRAHYPASQCVIHEAGRLVVGSGRQTIAEFVSSRYTPETLPYRIDVQRTHGKSKLYGVSDNGAQGDDLYQRRYEILWI